MSDENMNEEHVQQGWSVENYHEGPDRESVVVEHCRRPDLSLKTTVNTAQADTDSDLKSLKQIDRLQQEVAEKQQRGREVTDVERGIQALDDLLFEEVRRDESTAHCLVGDFSLGDVLATKYPNVGIEDSNIVPWPNLIKNLRLSCANDWLTAGEAPAHVIAAWIGHSLAVQNSSYAIVSDGHFETFNARPQVTHESGNHSGNKQPRIDANDHESELSPVLSPVLSPGEKTLGPMKTQSFLRRFLNLQRSCASHCRR